MCSGKPNQGLFSPQAQWSMVFVPWIIIQGVFPRPTSKLDRRAIADDGRLQIIIPLSSSQKRVGELSPGRLFKDFLFDSWARCVFWCAVITLIKIWPGCTLFILFHSPIVTYITLQCRFVDFDRLILSVGAISLISIFLGLYSNFLN